MSLNTSSTEIAMLDELGIKFGTDKSSKRHNYLHFYEKHLSRVRGSVSTVISLKCFTQ